MFTVKIDALLKRCIERHEENEEAGKKVETKSKEKVDQLRDIHQRTCR